MSSEGKTLRPRSGYSVGPFSGTGEESSRHCGAISTRRLSRGHYTTARKDLQGHSGRPLHCFILWNWELFLNQPDTRCCGCPKVDKSTTTILFSSPRRPGLRVDLYPLLRGNHPAIVVGPRAPKVECATNNRP